MSKLGGKHLRQRTTLFVLATLSPLFFAECSLILNDLPGPTDEPLNSSGGNAAGGTRANQGGRSGSGAVSGSGTGAENTGGVEGGRGGVGAGGAPTLAAGQGGNNATAGSGGDTAASGGTDTSGEGGGAGSGCPCDCDKDGALSDVCHAGGGPADCDDSDADVKPGQIQYFDEISNGGTFDYNCNDDIEQEEKELGTCPGLQLGECPPEEGFLAWPQCGAPGQWAQCKKSGLSCQPFVQFDKVLRCR